jgi:hypothetical protein
MSKASGTWNGATLVSDTAMIVAGGGGRHRHFTQNMSLCVASVALHEPNQLRV